MIDKQFMQLAIQLAKATVGQTSPNPSVGAVLVKNGQIVGMGSHLFAGSEHAEVHAIKMAGKLAIGSTLYVTLEPCVHFGKTPPCTDSVIKAGITHVVIATLDLNPQVAGRGVKALQDAGIRVDVGLLEADAKQINQVFFHHIQNKMPYITVKAGMSLDAKLATVDHESKWITNSHSREDAHHLRHTHDAILVGIGSVIADNPALTTRLPGGGKNPIRVILDTNLRTPIDATVVNDKESQTWIITGSEVTKDRVAVFENNLFVKIIAMPTVTLDLHEVLKMLAQKGITSILVEGGGKVVSSFLEARLVNQVVVYLSPMLIGGETAPAFFAGNGFAKLADAIRLDFESVEFMQDNLKIVAKVRSQECLPE